MRVRVRFSKLGKIRWTSHRDVARMWERAFRRVQLPVAHTNGFSPRPKVSFGLALPTGHESVAEYLDLELVGDAEPDLEELGPRLSAALPLGVDVTAMAVIEPGTPSLQEDVTSCTWRWIALPDDEHPPAGGVVGLEELSDRVARLLAAPSVVTTRIRKAVEVTDDIRGAVCDLRVVGPAAPEVPHGIWLEAELACQPRSLRPSELLAALDDGLVEHSVRRHNQWISRDGARWEPLRVAEPAGATDASHALGRAS